MFMATLVASGATMVIVGTAGVARAATTVPGAPGCPMFPGDNIWNSNISTLPVNVDNNEWMSSMDAAGAFLHPDFGPSGDPSNPYGIPYVVVPSGHPLATISFQYGDESDSGPYPFGADTPIEGGQNATGDRHAIMVDPTTCTLYELYDARYSPSGSTAGSGAIWNLRSDALRPEGWTSADAAGLPILPGLVDYDEVASGSMNHAIRFTAECTQNAYIWPARHQAGQANGACPPMGARFRLKGSFTLSSTVCSTMCQTVISTMKNFGMILADNGSNWYFQGTADTRWTYADVDQLKQIPANAFEAVDETSLMVNPDSGQASQPKPVAPPTTMIPPPTPTTISRPPVPAPVPMTTLPPTTSTPTTTYDLRERFYGRSSDLKDRPASPVRPALVGSTGAKSMPSSGLGPLAWLVLSLGVLVVASGSVLLIGRRGRRRWPSVLTKRADGDT